MPIGISPHAPYTCSLDVYRWCLSLGIPVGTHLAESAGENEWLEHGTGPLAAIADVLVPPTGRRAVGDARADVLGPDLLCAHCVDVDGRGDRACSRSADVPVAHCPRSNALLGCGIAPLAALRAAGVVVGLGTDSPGLDAVVRLVRRAARRRLAARARERRPDALHAADALRLATLDAARALGLDERGRQPDPRQARRPDGRVARGKPVRSG